MFKNSRFATVFLFIIGFVSCEAPERKLKISVAEWSLHRMIRSGKLTNLQFPGFVKQAFGVDGVEYVNQFFFDKAEDFNYLDSLKENCEKHGVQSLLIMVDGEGPLADTNSVKREAAVENHKKWVRAAEYLGCQSIRVNVKGKGSKEGCFEAAKASLVKLCSYAKQYNINIIIENHGGFSSDGEWLTRLVKATNMDNCGTLPDFGNFYEYDRYEGVREMMPYAKGVSAKTNGFNENGEDIRVDYERMMEIVKASNYVGYIGVEYEGPDSNELEGIQKTMNLIQKYSY